MNSRTELLARHLANPLRQALAASPVVVVTGARQTGKSTLIGRLLPGPRRYRTLDDIDLLERARAEPDALVDSRQPLALDEIQRCPDLLLAIKRAVDRDRTPGRFLLSGSASLALLGTVAESLAGRAVYLTLHPFTLSELAGRGGVGLWDTLLQSPGDLEGDHSRMEGWLASVLRGGFPPAALASADATRRSWFGGYVQTYLERDLQSLSAIENLVDFRRLMRIASLRTGGLVNQSEMGRDAGLAQATAHRYLNLLEASHVLYRLQPFAVNRTKRLVKAPRLYLCDPGLAAHLAGLQRPSDVERANLAGGLLETLVLSDLLAWREGTSPTPEVLFWRTSSGEEVDFVVESGDRLLPIEVKASARVRLADTRHLRSFLDEYGPRAPHGLILHTGGTCERLTGNIWAVPLGAALGLSGRHRRVGPAGRSRTASRRP